MAEKNALYIQNNNGTLVDLETGLMWMIPILGKTWLNGKSHGEPAFFDWHEAAGKYGKGKKHKNYFTEIWPSYFVGDNASRHLKLQSPRRGQVFTFACPRLSCEAWLDRCESSSPVRYIT